MYETRSGNENVAGNKEIIEIYIDKCIAEFGVLLTEMLGQCTSTCCLDIERCSAQKSTQDKKRSIDPILSPPRKSNIDIIRFANVDLSIIESCAEYSYIRKWNPSVLPSKVVFP